MSVWSRDDDSHDRMDRVTRAYQADKGLRAKELESKMAEVAGLLRDCSRYGSGLSPDECRELAKLLEVA